jgi:hypothetical protein
LADHILHDHEQLIVFRVVDVLHAHNVRVLKLPHHQSLGHERFESLLRSPARWGQHLEGFLLVPDQVPRPVHDAHAAPADLAQDLVLFADHGARHQPGAGAQFGAVAGQYATSLP